MAENDGIRLPTASTTPKLYSERRKTASGDERRRAVPRGGTLTPKAASRDWLFVGTRGKRKKSVC